MSPEEIVDGIVKSLKSKGADDVIASSQTRNAQQIKFSNNKINATKSWELSNISIFMVKDKKIVATNLKDISQESADTAVTKLIEFAKSTPQNKQYGGIADGPFSYKEILNTYDKKIEDINGVDYVEKAINLAQTNKINRCAGVFESYVDKIFLKTSNNIEVMDKGTRVYFSIRSFAKKDASGHMVCVSRTLNNFDMESTVNKSTHIANLALNPKSINSGKFDVIFDHLPFANLIANVGNAASAFSVEAGLSCLAGKLNKKVASSLFTLSDNAQLANGFNSVKFDAEGVPTSNTIIIEKGNLNTYLHNTSTAKRHNTKTTGNAGIISPDPYNLMIEPGDLSEEELFNFVKDGIYITNIWYTRFQNYNTGDFSTIPRDGAFLIKNGKIVHAVKDLRLSDNLLNILNSATAFGKETKQVFGWEVETPVITPMALIKNVNLTKSEE